MNLRNIYIYIFFPNGFQNLVYSLIDCLRYKSMLMAGLRRSVIFEKHGQDFGCVPKLKLRDFELIFN